ncbi:hypothetical protein ACFYU8_18315 [Brevibacillus sp. NPDC003359]|uniref:hypothetical protein n=1 Tax=unclassified Brevibacillus TaxID=2684853 RepID=UPI0036D02D11
MSNMEVVDLVPQYASFCEGRYVMLKKMANDELFTFIKDTDNLRTALYYVGSQLKDKKIQVSHLLYDQHKKEVLATNSLELLIMRQLKKQKGIVFIHPFEENIIWII